MENYAAIKQRLLNQVPRTARPLLGVDDEYGAAIFTQFSGAGGPTAWPVSVGKVLGRGIFVVDGTLYDAQGAAPPRSWIWHDAPHLPGAHNWQNAALAFAATKPFVKDARVIADAIVSFPGLAHRMEDVGPHRQVRLHQ